MKKLVMLVGVLLLCCTAALAQNVPDTVIREALLEEYPLSDYPTCEMMAEWHLVLGEEVDGDTAVVYAVADLTAFGEVNGVFLGRDAVLAPVVMTFERENGNWVMQELEYVPEEIDIEDVMSEEICEAYDDFDEDDAEEAIAREVKAWLKNAGRKLDVAVTYYDMDEDLDDVELPEDVWQLTVDWPVGYLDQLATCRYPKNGSMVSCTTAWEPDEDDDEYGLLTYIMTDDATGSVIESISILVTEDEAVISMEDANGSRIYTCVREDEEIVSYTVDTTGACSIDVTALEENLRIAIMEGIEAYN